jgi:hypothetical protein
MGNVISNDPPIPKRAATTHHTVFNMRHAVIISDTVDAKLARLFLIQARDPAFEGHWSAHIQKTALRLIKLRLMDKMYRTLVPENEIAIWPRRLTAPPGEALEFSMITIAEIIVKIYAPETAPHVKSIDRRCREAPFEYKMKDQDIEEKFIILYLQLIENHFLGETLSEKDDDRLSKIFYKKLPNLLIGETIRRIHKAELDGGLDTVEKAVLRVKKLLAVVRQAIRLASSYGPGEYVFRIENKDKKIPSSPPTHHNNQNRSSNDTSNAQNDKRSANDDKRTANDVTAAATPAFVTYCECCGGWGHDKPFSNGPNTLCCGRLGLGMSRGKGNLGDKPPVPSRGGWENP